MFSLDQWNEITRSAIDEINNKMGYNAAAYSPQRGIPQTAPSFPSPYEAIDRMDNTSPFNSVEQATARSSGMDESDGTEDEGPTRVTSKEGFIRGGFIDPLRPIKEGLSGMTPNSFILPTWTQQAVQALGPKQTMIPAGPAPAAQPPKKASTVRGRQQAAKTPAPKAPAIPPAMMFAGLPAPMPPAPEPGLPSIDTGANQQYTGSIDNGNDSRFTGSFGYLPGGQIPGPVDPNTGDDTMIPAKRGEYVIPTEVVSVLGKEALDNLVYSVKKSLGLDEPPKGMGIGPEEPGYARGGLMDDGSPFNPGNFSPLQPLRNLKGGYETDPYKVGDTTTLGGAVKGMAGAAAGAVGNLLTKPMPEQPPMFSGAYSGDLGKQASDFAAAETKRYQKPQPAPRTAKGASGSLEEPTAQAAAQAAPAPPAKGLSDVSWEAPVKPAKAPAQQGKGSQRQGGGGGKGKGKGGGKFPGADANMPGQEKRFGGELEGADVDGQYRHLDYSDGGKMTVFGGRGSQQPSYYDTPEGRFEMMRNSLYDQTHGLGAHYSAKPKEMDAYTMVLMDKGLPSITNAYNSDNTLEAATANNERALEIANQRKDMEMMKRDIETFKADTQRRSQEDQARYRTGLLGKIAHDITTGGKSGSKANRDVERAQKALDGLRKSLKEDDEKGKLISTRSQMMPPEQRKATQQRIADLQGYIEGNLPGFKPSASAPAPKGKQMTPQIAAQYKEKYKDRAKAEQAARNDGYVW